MKRAREDIIRDAFEHFITRPNFDKRALTSLLSNYGITVRDLNNVCQYSPAVAEFCRTNNSWATLYKKHIDSDLTDWNAARNMPNLFQRFMSFFVVKSSEDASVRFSSPSKNEEVNIESGQIFQLHRMPEGYQERWQREWLKDDDNEYDSDEDPDEMAEIAFNDMFMEQGFFMHYQEDEERGQEVQTLGEQGNVAEYVYRMWSQGWKTGDVEYPECNLCSQVSTHMCNMCLTPLCGQVCLLGHLCSN